MSVSWQRSTQKVCFTSEHLKAVMREDYSTSHNRILAYDNVAQKMMGDKLSLNAAG